MKMRNPKLLGLIRKGCSITFPSGVILRRFPDREFIESCMQGFDKEDFVSIDEYDLTEQGLEEAFEYEEDYAYHLEDNEELENEEQEEEMQ